MRRRAIGGDGGGPGSFIPYQQLNRLADGKQGMQPDLRDLMNLLIRRGSLGLGVRNCQNFRR